MAVRDDDPADATLEGDPVADDGADSEVLFAQSTEAPPARSRGFAPPPVTMPDMPAVTAVPAPLATTPSAPKPSAPPPHAEAPRRAPVASSNAAATVVASFKDIAAAAGVKLDVSQDGLSDGIDFNQSGEGGFIFDASAEGAPIDDGGGFSDDASAGFEDGATRPEVSAFAEQPKRPPPAPPAPPARTPTPPTSFSPFAPASPAPAVASSPPSFAPPRPPPADPTMLPPPTSLPGSPSFSFAPRTGDPPPRKETRGPVAGVGGGVGGGALDPPVAPPRKETRGPVAGVGGLDPPVPRKETRGPVAGVGGGSGSIDPPVNPGGGRKDKPRRPVKAPAAETSMPGTMPVTGASDDAGRSRLWLITLAVVAVIGVVAFLSRSETSTVTMGPREARALSDRARAVLATQARSDVEDPVRGVVRTLIGEGGRVIVVRDGSVDAWVLPDSTFVVTDALLRKVGSDAQLAAIAAHTMAHHRLGHFGALGDSLDGPALIVALRAHHAFDEEAADAVAGELLTKGGWRTRALVDVQEGLGATAAWTARHPRTAENIVEAMGSPSGTRDDKDWYRQKVKAVLDPPSTGAPTAVIPTTEN